MTVDDDEEEEDGNTTLKGDPEGKPADDSLYLAVIYTQTKNNSIHDLDEYKPKEVIPLEAIVEVSPLSEQDRA